MMELERTRNILRSTAATAAALGVIATGCGSDAPAIEATVSDAPIRADSAKPTAALTTVSQPDSVQELLGAIAGTEIYSAFTLSEKDGTTTGVAYFCDGKTVSQWLNFAGRDGSSITFKSPAGASFEGTLAGGEITGTVQLAANAGSYDVQAAEVPTDGDAGLYFADFVFEPALSDDERAGWIVLPDGSQRGAVRSTTSVLPGAQLNLSNLAVSVTGRNLTLELINQIIGLDMAH